MSDPLDALLELAGKHARRVLVETKQAELVPTFLMIAAKENIFAPVHWRNERHKAAILNALRAIMKESGVTRYSVVSEAWSAVQPMGMPQGPPPRDRADRKEVVIAIAADKLTAKSRTWDIVRGEGGAIVDLRLETGGLKDLGGRMADLLR